MRDMKIYSVLDVKAGGFLLPFFSRNNQTALRDFSAACQDQTHAFARHASDYVLHELGSWDEDAGTIVSHPPIAIGTAAEYAAVEVNHG